MADPYAELLERIEAEELLREVETRSAADAAMKAGRGGLGALPGTLEALQDPQLGEDLKAAGRIAAAEAAPYAGAALGSAVPPPFTPLGMAGGAALGEGARQYLKGEELNPPAMLAEGIIAGTGAGLGQVVIRPVAAKLLGMNAVKQIAAKNGFKVSAEARNAIRTELDKLIAHRTGEVGGATASGAITGLLSTLFTGHDPVTSAAIGAATGRWSPSVAKVVLKSDKVMDALIHAFTRQRPLTDVAASFAAIAAGDFSPTVKLAMATAYEEMGKAFPELLGIAPADAAPMPGEAVVETVRRLQKEPQGRNERIVPMPEPAQPSVGLPDTLEGIEKMPLSELRKLTPEQLEELERRLRESGEFPDPREP